MRLAIERYYDKLSRDIPKHTPKKMVALAKGVVAVEEECGECDVLFDSELWQFRHPEIWEPENRAENPRLKNSKLKTLPGMCKLPRVRSVDDAIFFAKEELVPALDWYDPPEPYSFGIRPVT